MVDKIQYDLWYVFLFAFLELRHYDLESVLYFIAEIPENAIVFEIGDDKCPYKILKLKKSSIIGFLERDQYMIFIEMFFPEFITIIGLLGDDDRTENILLSVVYEPRIRALYIGSDFKKLFDPRDTGV